MKQFCIAATVIAGLFCLPALVEWGAHNMVWLGTCALLLFAVLMAVGGQFADAWSERHP